jgi:antirestriction protein ArdC
MTPRHDIYGTVTNQLIAAIEAGAGTWHMPWSHSGDPIMRPTSVAGRRYNGINRLILWATADACGFSSGTFGTYQQWKSTGAQVRKGETGTHVILWKKVERQDGGVAIGNAGDGEGESRARFFARSFVVFNRDQVDGVDEGAVEEAAPITTSIADALTFLESVGVPVEYGLHDAYFRPDLDRIFMPTRSSFDSDLDLVSTLCHELVHSSGTASRLDRDSLRSYHKDRKSRQHEELVAEIGASFLMADLGLAYTPRPDHAAYLSSWLNALKSDTRAIFTAAAQAQAAADWIHAHAGANAVPLPIAA